MTVSMNAGVRYVSNSYLKFGQAPSFEEFKPDPAALSNTKSSLALSMGFSGGSFAVNVAQVLEAHHPDKAEGQRLGALISEQGFHIGDEDKAAVAKAVLYLQAHGGREAKAQIRSLAQVAGVIASKV